MDVRSAARAYVLAVRRYQSREITYLRSLGLSVQPGYRFGEVLNGFSADVPSSQLGRLRRATNVAAVLADRRLVPLLDKSAQLIHAPAAWKLAGGAANAGRGVYIADIDSGIDISNPCFKDAGFAPPPYGRRADTSSDEKLTNNKVVVARAFGDSPSRHYSAADVQGHGTFTASIEACDANTPTPVGTKISGIAPGAYLMNYNVFPAGSRGPYDDQVIAALDAALTDKADVVNISLGDPEGTGDLRLDPEAIAVGAAVKAGLVVVSAAGNGGPEPQSVSSPASSPDAIAVGSVTNSRGLYSTISGSGSGVPGALTTARAREGTHFWRGVIGPLRAVYVGLARRPGDGGNDFAGRNLRHAIAVIDRGNGSSPTALTIQRKIHNAAQAGAAGAIVVDSAPEPTLPSLDQGTSTLPMVLIDRSSGRSLVAWIHSHPDALVSMDSALRSFSETADVLSRFSSVGPSADYAIKPDLVAPGDDIYAATERAAPAGEMYDPSGFTMQSGTSFASPHVAGAAALLLQQKPTLPPHVVKALLMESSGTSVSGLSARKQTAVLLDGAGLVDVERAMSAPAYILPSSLSLGQVNTAIDSHVVKTTLSLTDATGGAGAWALSVQAVRGGSDRISVPARVSVAASGSVVIPVRVTMSGAGPGDYAGYINAYQNQRTLHVPYFIHVVHEPLPAGRVLLVDATASRFAAGVGALRSDGRVKNYYIRALKSVGRSYTYWNEAELGTPTVYDLRRASAVIYFTGNNLNDYAPANGDPDSLLPPLGPLDLEATDQYVAGGGHLFLSGIGVPLSDPNWLAVVLGARRAGSSVFGGSRTHSTIPWLPSAVPVSPAAMPAKSGIFVGLPPLDLSLDATAAPDNASAYNPVAGLVGVSRLDPVAGQLGTGLQAFGRPALRATRLASAHYLAVVGSDEPSFTHVPRQRGRTVLFSFGFEGIADTPGHATHRQVLGRIFQWFSDVPEVSLKQTAPRAGATVQLQANLRTIPGVRAVQWTWSVGTVRRVSASDHLAFTFPRAGRYTVRVQVVDSLGHRAVTPATVLTVY